MDIPRDGLRAGKRCAKRSAPGKRPNATARRLRLEPLEERKLLSGGGANVLLVVNPADENALRIANAYQELRGVPDSNIVFITPPTSNGSFRFDLTKAELLSTYVTPVANAIAARGLDGQIDYIATLGQPSRYVTPSYYGADTRNSLTYGLMLLSPLSGGLDSDKAVHIASGLYENPSSIAIGDNAAIYHSDHYAVTYGSAGVVDTQYYMAGSLGYTWIRGNTADQVIASLARAEAADGTHPTGTIYFEENDDVRSNTRESEWAATKAQLDARGIPWIEERLVSGSTPLNRTDVLGAVIGNAGYVAPNGSTYVAGSWADNLTSYGCTWDDRGQTKDSRLIASGVAATTGSVVEPYADSGRFTNSSVYVFLADGSTAGEAFAKSVRTPDIQMFLGDLLAQPQADLPVVELSSWPNEGDTVSGLIALSAAATLTDPQIATGLKQLELLVDGWTRDVVSAGAASFNLDTRTLSDGWHELRVVAVNNAAAESEDFVTRHVLVNNLGRSASAPGGDVAVDGGPTIAINVAATVGAGAVTRVELRHLGRTVGQLAAAGGAVSLNTGQLAYGDNAVTPVAVFSDGTETAGQPINVHRTPIYLAGVPVTPLGSRTAGIRGEYFYNKGNATIATSDFSGTPDAVATYNSLNLANTAATRLDKTLTYLPTTEIDKLAGRFTASFNVTAANAGEYNFYLWRTNDSAQLLVDGVSLASFDGQHNGATVYNNSSVFLGAGEHRLTLLTSNVVTGTAGTYYDISLEYRGPDGVTRIIDNTTFYETPPVATDANISISGATGFNGAFRKGDAITASWNNTAAGDNNVRPLTAVTFNFSQFGGGTAVPATNTGGIWTASFTLPSGALDAVNRNVSVTVTDLNGTATTFDASNATVDNQLPTITDARISISSAPTGTGGVYRIGDTVLARWDNTAAGDNNADALAAVNPVTVNFTQFGGGAAVPATNNAGVWTASYTLVAGAIDVGGRTLSVAVTDDAGNTTTTADTSSLTVDNQLPTVTDGGISVVSTGSGVGGAYLIGDTVLVRWDNTAAGDNNADALAAADAVTVDFTQFGGVAAVPAVNAGGLWTAACAIGAGALQAGGLNASVTVVDNAGNSFTAADTSGLTVDNQLPSSSGAAASAAIIADGLVGTATFWLTLTFDENMSPAAAPTVSFPGASPAGTLTLSAASAWANATTYVARFDVSDANTMLPAVDVRVSGAKDAAGNVQTPRDFAAVFAVESVNPTALDVSVNLPLLADAQAGAGQFTVSVAYSEPMNALAFPSVVLPAALNGTLHPTIGQWLDATHFLWTYDVTDANWAETAVDITVSGGRDVLGNLQVADTAVGMFAVNMVNPHVVQVATWAEAAAGANLDFEAAALAPWAPLGAGDSPGPYQLAAFDVGGVGRASQAFRIAPNAGEADGLSQWIHLERDVAYAFDAPIALANLGAAAASGVNTAQLLIDGVLIASFDFPATIGPGETLRDALHGVYTPTVSGPHSLALTFQGEGAEQSGLWMYADNVVVGREAGTLIVAPEVGTLVNDALVGGRLIAAVEFSAPMDVAVAPQLAFAPGLAGTLAFDAAGSYWTSPTMYVARYAIADAGVTVFGVGVSVDGARSDVGNQQSPDVITGAGALRVDTQNPAVTVASLVTSSRQPLLSGTVADVGLGGSIAGVSVLIAGQTLSAALQGNTWSVALPVSLPDGFYDVQATSVDQAGNTAVDASVAELTIDAMPPAVTIDATLSNRSQPRLQGGVYDPAPSAGVKTLSISVWGLTVTATVSGNRWSADLPGALDDGYYEVLATVVDNANNTAVDASHTELQVDATPPTTVVTPLVARNRRPTLTGTISDRAPGSGVTGLTVTVGGQTLVAALNGNAWSASVPADLADGVYDVRAVGFDVAGNSAPDATVGELNIDTTPPTATLLPVTAAATTVTLTGTAADPGEGCGVAAVMVTVAGQSYMAALNGSAWTATLPAPAADGPYDVSVMAVDRIGNNGFDATVNELIVDRAVPTVASLSVWRPDALGGNFAFEQGDLSAWTPLNAGAQPGPYQVVSFDVGGSGRTTPAFRLAPNTGADDGLSRQVWLDAGASYVLHAAVAEENNCPYANSGVDRASLLIDGVVIDSFSFTDAVGLLPAQTAYRAALHGVYTAETSGLHTLSIVFWRRFVELPEIWAYVDDVSVSRAAEMALRDADLGASVEMLAVYSEPMDMSQVPQLAFAPNVARVLRLDAAASHWVDATTYTAVYRVSAGVPVAPDVAVTVSGARDSNNHVQTAGTFENRFDVATTALSPTLCGVYDPAESKFFMKYANQQGFADLEFGFGAPGWKPLAGDWDGDGRDTIGLFQPDAAQFYLRNANSSGPADISFGYGDPALGGEYALVMGDWDGDGVDTIGLYHQPSATWFLRNSNSQGNADQTFGFGSAGSDWTPVVGDWNGDGVDAIGLYDPATGMFYLRNALTTGMADIAFPFGAIGSGWTPLIGDWNGDGRESAGFHQSGAASHFYLRNDFTPGMADVDFGLGFPGAVPIVGDWLGTTGQALMLGGEGRGAGDEGLSVGSAQLAPLVAEAIARWADAGVSIAAPRVVVTDLPGAQLGRAQGGAIYLDRDAAGHGWFIDPTPAVDEEFSNSGAAVDPRAVDRIDLLTVVEHELGHLAGLSDLDAALETLMSGALPDSVRRKVSL